MYQDNLARNIEPTAGAGIRLFTVPKNAFKAGTIHFILAVTDGGRPALTRYQRVIINVTGPMQE